MPFVPARLLEQAPAQENGRVLFSLIGFPCSGMDWVGRMLARHPRVLVMDSPDALGPLGDGDAVLASRVAMVKTTKHLVNGLHEIAAAYPDVTHMGIVTVDGLAGTAGGTDIVVLRDGRDVVVNWTIRQLRENGAALRRFLADPGSDSRIPELVREFAAGESNVLVRQPALLLADYDWMRYAVQLWDDCVSGHAGSMGAIADQRIPGPYPVEVFYEHARSNRQQFIAGLLERLGLDPNEYPRDSSDDDGASDGTATPELNVEWEVGRWRGYFTPRAAKLFKMDGWSALEYVAKVYDQDDWDGNLTP